MKLETYDTSVIVYKLNRSPCLSKWLLGYAGRRNKQKVQVPPHPTPAFLCIVSVLVAEPVVHNSDGKPYPVKHLPVPCQRTSDEDNHSPLQFFREHPSRFGKQGEPSHRPHILQIISNIKDRYNDRRTV